MMRKLIIGLTLVAATTILAGCGNDQYGIEKRYWQVQKQAEKIFKNPAASPPRELERVVNLLDGFVKKYPLTNLAFEAEINVSRLYIVKEEYEKARLRLRALLSKYSKSAPISSEVTFLIGNSYEIEDKWNSALEQYKKIMREYPITLRGIDIPVYIAQHYKIKYEPDKMIAAFQEAIAHYKALAAKYPGSPLAYNLDNLVAQCYEAVKDWQNAIASLNAIIDNYKAKVPQDETMLTIALVYKNGLKDNAKAKATLERLIKEYPKSRLVKAAGNLLKGMEKEK
jgi:TolA-binding protein